MILHSQCRCTRVLHQLKLLVLVSIFLVVASFRKDRIYITVQMLSPSWWSEALSTLQKKLKLPGLGCCTSVVTHLGPANAGAQVGLWHFMLRLLLGKAACIYKLRKQRMVLVEQVMSLTDRAKHDAM